MSKEKEYFKFLHDNDIEDFESPINFDQLEANTKFDHMIEIFKNKIEIVFIDNYESIQDASFFANMTFKAKNSEIKYDLYASNHGKMITIENLEDDSLNWLIEIFENAGYTYIPYLILNNPYNGVITYLKNNNSTWMDRFFNYG